MRPWKLFILLVTAILLMVPVSVFGAIVEDGTSSTMGLITDTLTWNHTVTSNSKGILIVGISMSQVPGVVAGTVTYNGDGLTPIGSVSCTTSRVQMFYILTPDIGTHEVRISMTGAIDPLLVIGGAASFTGVDQAAPLFGPFASNTGLLIAPTLSVPTTSNTQVVVDTVSIGGVNLLGLSGPTPPQVELWRVGNLVDLLVGGGSRKAGAVGSVTMSWISLLGLEWAIGATVINAAPVYQPDAMIKNDGEADSAYLTANFYETTASVQAKAQSVINGTAAIYTLKFVNNGTGSDSIKITGTATGSGFTVQYMDGPTDRTSEVTGGGYTIGPLAADESRVWTLRVTPGGTVVGGTSYAVNVTATSVGDGTKVDQVKATTKSISPVITVTKLANKPSFKPGEDITYSLNATNHADLSPASSLSVTDPIPANTGFKVGSASFNPGSSTLTATPSYSSQDSGTDFSYTPVSGGCSAPAGYDYCVKRVKWTMTGTMPTGTWFSAELVVRVK